jgi:hypothetical protein
MILPFSTQLNGKPTYFVERIWEALLRHYFQDDKEYVQFMNNHKERFGTNWDWFPDEHQRLTNPKIHTIREDKNNRWKPGTMIDFFINCRQKNMFRFAPQFSVVSVQEIFMTYYHSDVIKISINGRELFGHPERLELALNDGFDTWEDFFNYFYPIIQKSEDKCFTGKIIHWTDLKY